MIDHFGPHHVLTADDERMSEIEQAFEVVRGRQLLGGARHLEREIRRSSGGFRPRRSWKLHALCSSLLSFAFKGELTVLKPRKITRDNTEKQR